MKIVSKKLAYILTVSSSLFFTSKVLSLCPQKTKTPIIDKFKHLTQFSQFKLAECLNTSYNSMLVEINSKTTNYLISKLRDTDTDTQKFRRYAKRLIRILIEESLSQDVQKIQGLTKLSLTKTPYHPYQLKYRDEEICVVSIMRSGDSLVDEFMKIVPNCSVGKILLQRQQQRRDKKPQFYYSKLPKSIKSMKRVFLLDPMLATGGSASMAIEKLKEQGVNQENIVFINIIACPQGIKVFRQQYPKVKIVTAIVDQGLNSDCFIVPGLGDFGDRYFGSSL